MKFGYEDLDVWHKARCPQKQCPEGCVLLPDPAYRRDRAKGEFALCSLCLCGKQKSVCPLISRGSLYETMTMLEIFRRNEWVSDDRYSQVEARGIELASMIKGLINSIE
jgi:hypothetical protein